MEAEPTPRTEARGDATRRKLIDAALDLFGTSGFAGVGTREIATAAGVPLAAIPYHFGTKAALYRAVLEQVVLGLREALAAPVAAARGRADGTPREARRALAVFRGALLDTIAVKPESERWARLLLREHLDPGEAYDVVYEGVAKDAVDCIASLIARAEGRDRTDKDVLIRAFAAMGEVLIFRVTQHALTRRLGWKTFRPTEAERVKTALGWREAD